MGTDKLASRTKGGKPNAVEKAAQEKLWAPPRRRPRFRDRVCLDGQSYYVCASVVSPSPGYWIRPEGAADAGRDRLLALTDFAALTWNSRREQWETA